MDISNILLWTASLLLAIAGIFFGIIASINSSKANKKLKEIISEKIVSDEAQKYFFYLSNKSNTSNKKVLVKLRSKSNYKYSEYSILAVSTRMTPMPPRLLNHLENSEFSSLTSYYIESKRAQEIAFKKILPDFSVLIKDDVISEDHKNELISYHLNAQKVFANIMKEYYKLIMK